MEIQNRDTENNQQLRDRDFVLDPNECALTEDNDTIVVFGVNTNNVIVLASLLSNDGNLKVIVDCNGIVKVVNPKNPSWRPYSKYILCRENTADGIESFLKTLKEPFRFIMTIDYTDIWISSCFRMIKHLGGNLSKHRSNELVIIALNIPHDEQTLRTHVNHFKEMVESEINVDFKINGMHDIERSGPISEMPELLIELGAIQSITGQF